MSRISHDFESLAEKFNAEVLQSFKRLIESFEAGDNKAFSIILQSCHKVDLTPKALADMADVSPNTIRRWTETGAAGKYHQRGLVEDIKDYLEEGIKEV